MAFAPGLHAFPGGRVDAADADALLVARSSLSPDDAGARLGDNVPGPEALAIHHAAIRELFEEVGVLLADPSETIEPARIERSRAALLDGAGLADALSGLDVVLRPDRLTPIALWTTPTFMPRRFATWFLVADLPVGAEPSIVGEEVAGLRWLGAGAALDLLAGGEIEMWVPTTSVLERLVETRATTAAAVSEALTFGRLAPPRVIDEGPEHVRILCFGAGGLPGRTCTTSILGRRDVLVVDPGDPSEPAVGRIVSIIGERGATLRAVVLTATDPDHAAAAEALAIPAECPILVAPGAGRRLPYATMEIDESTTLPADIDVRVRLGSPGSGRLELDVGLSAGATRPGSE